MSYKVKKGDTLSKIAKENNISLNELLELNGISKDKANDISIGQEIKITKDQNSSNFSQIGFKSPYPITMDWKSYHTDDKSMSTPFKEDYTEDDYIKDNAENIQRQLKEAGYHLGSSGKNKDGIDGKWGNKSQTALDSALAEGYTLVKGKLIPPKTTTKPQSANKEPSPSQESQPTSASNENPGFLNDTVNWVLRHNPLFKIITKAPYKGTEEEARTLGYKHYTNNGFTRKTVDYPVEDAESMTPQQRAQAQLDQYGITEEQVRDKSPMGTFVYQYAPGYGYNVLRMLENIAKGQKVRENGKRNTEELKTPWADETSKKIAEYATKLGWDKFASDLIESTTYPVSESASRNDISNFYFGYPMQGKTLKVSPHTVTGGGNEPDAGYFMEFRNGNHIYNDKAYKDAAPGRPAQATGENMGTWAAAITPKGKRAYYDLWDINPLTHIPGFQALPNMDFLGTPFELYGEQK